jgi:hypothetical protein
MNKQVHLLVIAVLLFSCSHRETESPKARTLAAWKAFQKVDHDFDGVNLPPLRLDDLPTFPPNIKYYRDVAFAYSQIDLEGVDEILTRHLRDSIKAHNDLANALQSAYADVVELMKSREGELGVSREVGKFLADDEHQNSGAAFAQLFYQFMTDDNFQSKLNEIRAKHRAEVTSAEDEWKQVSAADETVAKTLSEKYGTQFVDSF